MSKNFFTPVVYVPNDQRVMGIILRYVCWGTHRPPPPPPGEACDTGAYASPVSVASWPWGGRRLTGRPT